MAFVELFHPDLPGQVARVDAAASAAFQAKGWTTEKPEEEEPKPKREKK